MFTINTSEAVSFDQIEEPSRESKTETVQTVPISEDDKLCQTYASASVEVQTEPVKLKSSASYCEASLSSFLNKICPLVLKELDKAEKTKAFTTYRTVEETSEGVTLKHTINAKKLPSLPHLIVTSMSWNCSGSTLVIAFGSSFHDGWCLHESSVHIYNMNKYKFDGSNPDKEISTRSCVTAVSMHPYDPALLAVGTHSGDILVYNVFNETMENFQNLSPHSSRITKLAWISITNQLYLISSALDGLMHTYKVNPGGQMIQLFEKFKLNDDDKILQGGVTCFGFSKQPGIFVAALEGGEILYCSTFTTMSDIKRPESATPTKRPVLKSFGKELGPVSSIEFSPYKDNLFATAHAENSINIWSIIKECIVQEISTNFNVIGLLWSLSQANAILSWGSCSKIAVFDTTNGKFLSEIEPESSRSDEFIHMAAMNPKSDNTIAVSGLKGKSYVWNIPRYFDSEV